jgi:hypothetical protein
MTMTDKTGGCLCGNVRYQATGEPLAMVLCQCTHCQRSTGSAFAVLATYPKDAVFVTQGAVKVYDDQGDGALVRRAFCGDCGSPIFAEATGFGEVCSLLGGTLDDQSDLNPTVAGFCSSAQPWVKLPDTMDKMDRW